MPDPDQKDPIADDMDIFAISTGLDSVGAVCEVYSPPRVVPEAEAAHLPGGWSLDLTTEDSEGRAWDFDRVEVRARCRELVRRTRPMMLIGSPMCTWFSTLQAANRQKVGPEEWARQRARALMHLNCVC